MNQKHLFKINGIIKETTIKWWQKTKQYGYVVLHKHIILSKSFKFENLYLTDMSILLFMDYNNVNSGL